MNDELAVLFAKRFIQRRDVKAVQVALPDKVIYTPDREMRNLGSHGPLGFKMDHLKAHLESTATYGHYLLDQDSNAKMFCFDIDLKDTGFYAPEDFLTNDNAEPIPFNPREAWLDRAHPSRQWQKTQLGMIARKLCSAIIGEFELPCAAAYSGNKGVHVYGFTGILPADEIRKTANYILDVTGDWELERGKHIFRHKVQDPFLGYPNINLEVYPKQDSLDSKDLGNLLRLPLGKNLKNPQDPTFFLDLTTPPGVMAPHKNPVQLLTTGNPYE